MKKTGLIVEDPVAHCFEHSIEVQIPFVQKMVKQPKIVPIAIGCGSLAELDEIADSIALSIKESGSDAMVLASSDMTHYEPREIAEEKDNKAIQAILELDPVKLLSVVEENNISMCGCLPTVIMLMIANKLGAKNAGLIKYSDSGDATGDLGQVVGYAGMIVY